MRKQKIRRLGMEMNPWTWVIIVIVIVVVLLTGVFVFFGATGN